MVGTSDCQNNNISQKCDEHCEFEGEMRVKGSTVVAKIGIIFRLNSRHNMWILERQKLDDCYCFDTFCTNIFSNITCLLFSCQKVAECSYLIFY